MTARRWLLPLVVVLPFLFPAAAPAETVVEAWRGGGFASPCSVSVNPTDSSCWVADSGNGQVVHLSALGTELWRGGGFSFYWIASTTISAYPGDGSCWVSDSGNDRVVHLSSTGEELWSGGGFPYPTHVFANPADGSCWVGTVGGMQIIHLTPTGEELWRGSYGAILACVAPTDGSLWLGADLWVHITADGQVLWRDYEDGKIMSVSPSPRDGSCWGTVEGGAEVMRVSSSGEVLSRSYGFQSGNAISTNPADGTCWIADMEHDQVVHLSASGTELWRGGGFYHPCAVAVHPTDGSCWVADYGHGQVVHLVVAPLADFSASPLAGPAPLGVDFTDLSVASPTGPITAWDWDFGDGGASTEQNPSHQYTSVGTYTVSLTVTDASGSDTETKADYIHVTAPPPVADFTAFPLAGPAPLDVDFLDLSVASPTGSMTAWAWDFGDGGTSTEQNPSHDYTKVGAHTVTLTVSSLGGCDTETKAHYIHVTFPDVPVDYWAMHQILACVDAGIVQGYPDGTYRPEQAVTRDQMAVYISRALAGGDEHVPSGPETPTFPDVPTDHWAFKYIEYCYDEAVVEGYSDGYHPSEIVTRGQMAVFIARALVAPSGDAAIPDPEPPPTFPDVPATYWAYKWIEYCHAQGLVQGYWDGYHPEEVVNRAQMAVYVQRAFDLPL